MFRHTIHGSSSVICPSPAKVGVGLSISIPPSVFLFYFSSLSSQFSSPGHIVRVCWVLVLTFRTGGPVALYASFPAPYHSSLPI